MYTLQLDRCMCTILTRHASINQIKSHWKTSEGEKQAYICCMFVEGKSKTVFFPSDTLIYGICRDGTKNNNIRACEHLILGQFRMGARSAIYAPLRTGMWMEGILRRRLKSSEQDNKTGLINLTWL